eukprot:GHVT01078938.1.p3 GENE.GHVT01078938.1~~GHVT01078938.1.p3  ORF type:complete len:161 (-),score=28.89 GHVT01078938.1:2124-2606(-)
MAIATASASYAMSPRQRVAALEQRRLAHRTSQLYQFQRQEQQLADLQDICGRLRRDPPSERDDVAPVVAKVQRHLQETAGRLEQQGKEAIERTLWHLEKTCEQERGKNSTVRQLRPSRWRQDEEGMCMGIQGGRCMGIQGGRCMGIQGGMCMGIQECVWA